MLKCSVYLPKPNKLLMSVEKSNTLEQTINFRYYRNGKSLNVGRNVSGLDLPPQSLAASCSGGSRISRSGGRAPVRGAWTSDAGAFW